MFTRSLSALALVIAATPALALAQDADPQEETAVTAGEAVDAAAQAIVEAESDVEAGAADGDIEDIEDAIATAEGAADAMADEVVEEEAEAPVQTYILSANARFLAEYGDLGWLSPELEICLEEGESVQLARPATEIAAMELRGPLCTRIADAQDVASIVIDRADEPAMPVRGAIVRGTASGTGRTVIFRVATGSPEVMEAYPRGTVVRRSTEICLEAGQQVTLISTSGQRVTYRGPGCARRETRPSGSNLGGFTFGWNGFDAELLAARRL